MRYAIILVVLFLSAVSFSGCALFLVGAGVAGGIAISKDTVQTDIENNFKRVWGVAVSELNQMGRITLKDRDAGKIQAVVRDTNIITLTVYQTSPHITRMQIKARKNLFPNINIAHEISNRILSRF